MMDITFSMGPVINQLKNKIISISKTLSEKLGEILKSNVKIRFAFVGYRDYTKDPTTGKQDAGILTLTGQLYFNISSFCGS